MKKEELSCKLLELLEPVVTKGIDCKCTFIKNIDFDAITDLKKIITTHIKIKLVSVLK